jgi:hypothetical protein
MCSGNFAESADWPEFILIYLDVAYRPCERNRQAAMRFLPSFLP